MLDNDQQLHSLHAGICRGHRQYFSEAKALTLHFHPGTEVFPFFPLYIQGTYGTNSEELYSIFILLEGNILSVIIRDKYLIDVLQREIFFLCKCITSPWWVQHTLKQTHYFLGGWGKKKKKKAVLIQNWFGSKIFCLISKWKKKINSVLLWS